MTNVNVNTMGRTSRAGAQRAAQHLHGNSDHCSEVDRAEKPRVKRRYVPRPLGACEIGHEEQADPRANEHQQLGETGGPQDRRDSGVFAFGPHLEAVPEKESRDQAYRVTVCFVGKAPVPYGTRSNQNSGGLKASHRLTSVSGWSK